MTDEKLAAIDAEIARLNNQRIARVAEIQDPHRAEIKHKYELVAILLQELEDMGEAITREQGYPLCIEGAYYKIDYDLTVKEL